MAVPGGFPARGLWRRPALRWPDVLVVAALIALLYGLLRLGPALNAPFLPKTAPSEVSTDPANLPYYAVRSLLRMFVALLISLIFTFVYATAAARLRRAEKVLIPVLDILQSVPVLGFLAVTVTAFINLFPGSELGLEAASVFAIFTSMAWNMTFAFYHSLVSQPRDLDEAARIMRLTRWERFWRLDVPSGMIPLVWNGMLSFGGAWFFLAASESISVLNHHYALPGIGSYVATAIAQANLSDVGLAILVMIVLVIGVNFVFWRPVTAWAERFRVEESEAAERPRSLVLDVLRRSQVPEQLGRPLQSGRPAARPGHPPVRPRRAPADRFADTGTHRGRVLRRGARRPGCLRRLGGPGLRPRHHRPRRVRLRLRARRRHLRPRDRAGRLRHRGMGADRGVDRDEPEGDQVRPADRPGARQLPGQLHLPVRHASCSWPGTSRLNFGAILLMALGAQWYILFNVIAGASAIPSDLREAMTNLRVRGWLRWKNFILPAVFASYVTGGITAAGGAWNASIVAEIVSYGPHHLTATGLGAYIAEATATGNFPKILVGIAVMSVYVVLTNRLFWRRLYALAERRYSL